MGPAGWLRSARVRPLLQTAWGVLLGALVGLAIGGSKTSAALIPVGIVFVIVLAYWLLTEQFVVARFASLGRLPGSAPMPRLKLDPAILERSDVAGASRADP